MSAFIVDDGHIDVLVSAAFFAGPHPIPLQIRYIGGETRDEKVGIYITCENGHPQKLEWTRSQLGQLLVNENYNSVNFRYNQKEQPHPYSYQKPKCQRSPVEVIKLVHGYEYQTCEHEGWRGSAAYQVCETLVRQSCHKLATYNNSDWTVSR